MDIDSIEGMIFDKVVAGMISSGETKIDTIVVEMNQNGCNMNCWFRVLSDFQTKLGYDAFLLDTHSEKIMGELRVFNAHGVNIGASYTGSGAWAGPEASKHISEHEHVRFFRHLFHVDRNLSAGEWGDIWS